MLLKSLIHVKRSMTPDAHTRYYVSMRDIHRIGARLRLEHLYDA